MQFQVAVVGIYSATTPLMDEVDDNDTEIIHTFHMRSLREAQRNYSQDHVRIRKHQQVRKVTIENKSK